MEFFCRDFYFYDIFLILRSLPVSCFQYHQLPMALPKWTMRWVITISTIVFGFMLHNIFVQSELTHPINKEWFLCCIFVFYLVLNLRGEITLSPSVILIRPKSSCTIRKYIQACYNEISRLKLVIFCSPKCLNCEWCFKTFGITT